MSGRKNKRAKACDISTKVKNEVWRRDGECILCGSRNAIPSCHYISRAHGGLGIPENIVTLCLDCHRAYDGVLRNILKPRIRAYLQSQYPDWEEENMIYRKWS